MWKNYVDDHKNDEGKRNMGEYRKSLCNNIKQKIILNIFGMRIYDSFSNRLRNISSIINSCCVLA